MNEKQITKILVKELLKLGFVVHRYNSFTTNSIYLKLDFGVCCGIRIADHNGKKKYHYRFNLIKDYKGEKATYYKSLISYFYTFNELEQLINDIQKEKQAKLQKYGVQNYKLYMEKEKNENNLFERFENVGGKNESSIR